MRKIAKKLFNKIGLDIHRFRTHETQLSVEDRNFIEQFCIESDDDARQLLIQSLDLVKSLVYKADATFFLQDGLKIKIKELTFNIQTWEDIFILNEVFVSEIYNIVTHQQIVIWDIGMNIGIASLYFSLKNYVTTIFGYEPVKDTYDRALDNFLLNPTYSRKINSLNLGVGNESKKLVIDYCNEWKGSVGIEGILKPIGNQQIIKREVSLIDAPSALNFIRTKYPDLDIVAKIDCEGAEYEIVEALFAENKLKDLKTIIVEWHNKKKNNQLLEQLISSGFNVICMNHPENNDVGSIYASLVV